MIEKLATCPDETLIAIANEIECALRLLGADGMLQAAVNSLWEGDFELSREFLSQWNEYERDRIAAVMREYARFNSWTPDLRYCDSVHRGCSHLVSLSVQNDDQSLQSERSC